MVRIRAGWKLAGALLLAAGWLMQATQASASAATLYLSPGARTVSQGSVFGVAVRVNTGGDPVNAVQANLSYDAAQLDVTSISDSGSAFDVRAQTTSGGGQIQIARGVIGSVSGDNLVATIYFRAKLAGGAVVSVNFAGGSHVVRSTDNVDILAGTSGGRYTMITAPPAPPAAPPPVVDTTPPTVTQVRVAAVTLDNATIAWQTNEPATSVVEFGLNTSYGLTAQTDGLSTSHSVAIPHGILAPLGVYHFRVKSADASGNLTTGQDGTFKTRGYGVTVTVTDQWHHPVSGALVTISDLVRSSDKQGVVNFPDTPAGHHLMEISYKHVVVKDSVYIAPAFTNGQAPIKQIRETLVLPVMNWWPYVGGGLIGLILLLWVVLRRRVTVGRRWPVVQLPTSRPGLTPHQHTGKLVAHHHTSYTALAFLLLLLLPIMLLATSGTQASQVKVQAAVLGPPLARGAVIVTPAGGSRFNQLPVTVSGTCPVGSSVVVSVGENPAGAAACAGEGYFALAVDLVPGVNFLTARNFDMVDQLGPVTPSVTVYYDQPTPSPANIGPVSGGSNPTSEANLQLLTHKAYQRGLTNKNIEWTVQLAGGQAPYALHWEWGDGKSDLVSLAAPGGFYAHHRYSKNGDYTVTVTASDANGRSAHLTLLAIISPVADTAPAATSGWVMVAWPIFGLLALMVISFWLGERFGRAHEAGVLPRVTPA